MTTSPIRAGILGLGSHTPEKVLTNFDLEKMVDTSDEWIVKRTGISERRILDNNSLISELGGKSAEKALANAGLKAEDIDLIIATTSTPDYLCPSMACLVQKYIGAVNAAAFDLNAACTGFVYGLTVAEKFISSGFYKHILLVACEGLSRTIDWEDRNSCVLFGDGSGAAVIGPVEDGYGIIASYLGADGSNGHLITIPCCSITEADLEHRPRENKRALWLDGSEVFKFAVRMMPEATEKVLEKAGMTKDDIDLIIPHQANIRIIDGAAKRLGIPPEKVFTNVHKYGNISSASIPVALEEAVNAGQVKKGYNIVLVGFGAGLTWGSVIMRWNK